MTRRTTRTVLVQAPVFEPTTPSHGLALMSAHLKARGLPVSVVDASMSLYLRVAERVPQDTRLFESFLQIAKDEPDLVDRVMDEAASEIASRAPDVVGFSVLAYTESWSLDLARRVKRLLPRCSVVFGGAQCMRETMALDFIRRPEVDAVALGEADRSFPEFVSAFKHGARLAATPGMLVKSATGFVDGGDSPEFEDLDGLPLLDFSGFDMDRYSGETLFLSTSRGCVRKCSFCTHIVQQKVFRAMSAARTLAEIRHKQTAYPGRCLVEFNDSLVNGDVARLAELSELLAGYRAERLLTHPGKDFGWTGMAILHRTMTPELLRKMRLGGCRILRYGLESGSQKIVDLMRKNFLVADAERILIDTNAAGIEARLYVLVGFPGETEDDFQMTLDFIERNAASIGGVMLSPCEIQRASHLDEHPELYDIRLPIADRLRWVSRDGSNNPEVRERRLARAFRLIERLGLSFKRRHVSRTSEFAAAPEVHS